MLPGVDSGMALHFRSDDQVWRIEVSAKGAGEPDDVTFLGFEVCGPDALAALRRRLRETGVVTTDLEPSVLAARGVSGMFSCRDPDRLQVEFYWGRMVRGEAVGFAHDYLDRAQAPVVPDLVRHAIAATALVVRVNRRATEAHSEPTTPDAPPPESLVPFRPPFAFYDHTDARYVVGQEWLTRSETRTLLWSSVACGRPLDALQLAYVCDVSPPRAFYGIDGPRPCPTVTLSLYVHATDEELAGCGHDYILADVIGTRIGHSLAGSRGNFWSGNGTLLATTEQLQWVKAAVPGLAA